MCVYVCDSDVDYAHLIPEDLIILLTSFTLSILFSHSPSSLPSSLLPPLLPPSFFLLLLLPLLLHQLKVTIGRQFNEEFYL